MTENPIYPTDITSDTPHQTPNNIHSLREPSLVERLNIVKSSISTKLSEGEMCSDDYSTFLYSQLQQQEFLPEGVPFNSSNFLEINKDTRESPLTKFVYFKTQFVKLLNLQTVEGFSKSYTHLLSTPLNEKTQEDLVDYDNLVQQTMSYILNDLNGTIPKSKYISSILEFVKESTIEGGVSETHGLNLGLRVSLQLDHFKEHIKFTEEPKNGTDLFDSAFDYLNET